MIKVGAFDQVATLHISAVDLLTLSAHKVTRDHMKCALTPLGTGIFNALICLHNAYSNPSNNRRLGSAESLALQMEGYKQGPDLLMDSVCWR